MRRENHLKGIQDLERILSMAIREMNEEWPHKPYCREQLLFQYDFFNVKILQPMDVTKKIGPFSGQLVFKDAEGDALDISKVTGLALAADNAAIGNVTLDPATGKFTGNGIAAGKLTLTATLTNDAGNPVTGVSTITFSADTTVTEVDVNVN